MLIRWIDLGLYIICGITLVVAGMDLYQLNDIQKEVLDRCNAHWEQEVEDKCSIITTTKFPQGRVFLTNFTIRNIE